MMMRDFAGDADGAGSSTASSWARAADGVAEEGPGVAEEGPGIGIEGRAGGADEGTGVDDRGYLPYTGPGVAGGRAGSGGGRVS